MKSCLEMRDKVVDNVMTPLESVYMLDDTTHIDKKTMTTVSITAPAPVVSTANYTDHPHGSFEGASVQGEKR